MELVLAEIKNRKGDGKWTEKGIMEHMAASLWQRL